MSSLTRWLWYGCRCGFLDYWRAPFTNIGRIPCRRCGGDMKLVTKAAPE